MTPTDRSWHAHLMHRPGWFIVGFVQLALGLGILVAVAVGRPWFGVGPSAGIMTFAVVGLASAIGFAPSGSRFGTKRILLVAWTPALAFGLHVLLMIQRASDPHPAYAAGAVLAGMGSLLLLGAEWDRRRVRLRFEADDLVVTVRRFDLEHRLPLEAVRDVEAQPSPAGRVFRYGNLLARARKGTMKDRISKPMVGEAAPDDAMRGNGWDEDERFYVIAAHPYKRFQRELEARIRFAKLPPKERQEQELADRLAADLDDLPA